MPANFGGVTKKLFSQLQCLGIMLLLVALLPGCGFLGFSSKPPPAELSKHKIACSAWGQMGKRYRSGGASPQKGFDCSGLVWWSYHANGIKIPRITSDQARAGRKVTRKTARPGDIVVFRTGNSPRGLHTGIYAGNGKFIHSPSKGKTVCLESLNTDYWRKRLLAFRHVGK